MPEAVRPIRVAAVQLRTRLGAVDDNLGAAERLVRAALARGAQWIVLPEFFTSGMAFHPSLLDAARPADGEPARLLERLARRGAAVVGGSFLARVGERTFNRFLLCFPDGAQFTHDKDLPTMWENCYYEGGSDDGVLETPSGPVGVALCWELIRAQTIARLRGRVRLAVGGSCWWTVPRDAQGPRAEQVDAWSRTSLRAAPARFARLLGVPFVHASCAGDFEGLTPEAPERSYRSSWLGESQIVDARGGVLARRSGARGEGVLVADLEVGAVPEPQAPLPGGFWLLDLPEATRRAWEEQADHGRRYYAEVTQAHRRAAAARRRGRPGPSPVPRTQR